MGLLDDLQACVTKLEATNSINDKLAILKKFPQLHEFIGRILDPMQKTHVTRASLLKYETEKFPKFHSMHHKKYPADVEGVYNALVTQSVSGDEAKEMVVVFLQKNPKHRELILRILEKELKIRLGMTQFRKIVEVTPESVSEKYQPALAHDLEKHMAYFQESSKNSMWYISRKLDGVRCQVWVTDKGCRAMSRTGHRFDALALLEQKVHDAVAPGYVLDGELCVVDEKGNESFSAAVSQVRRKSAVMKSFCFCLLDVVTDTEFQLGSSPLTVTQRRRRADGVLAHLLAQNTPTQKVVWVEQVPYSEENMALMQRKVDQLQWEGLILRHDVAYAGKRTKDLLKVKKFHTEEYRIQDVKTGPVRIIDPKTGLETVLETVTAVKILHKNCPVYVGSGFSLAERQKMFKDPQKVIGQVIAVQYFEETQDSKTKAWSLRFPTFKYWYGQSRDT